MWFLLFFQKLELFLIIYVWFGFFKLNKGRYGDGYHKNYRLLNETIKIQILINQIISISIPLQIITLKINIQPKHLFSIQIMGHYFEFSQLMP
jgi:hypothetical protein